MMCSFSSLAEFASLRAKIFNEFREVPPQAASELFVALNEAVNNALFHGNGGDAGRSVLLRIARSATAVVVSVKDEGGGFDYRSRLAACRGKGLPAAGRSLPETGRGLDIICGCVDRVEFNGPGNEIVLIKEIGRGKRRGAGR